MTYEPTESDLKRRWRGHKSRGGKKTFEQFAAEKRQQVAEAREKLKATMTGSMK